MRRLGGLDQELSRSTGACLPGDKRSSCSLCPRARIPLHAAHARAQGGYFHQPLSSRLAFREFGTTLGLQAWGETHPCVLEAWSPRLIEIHAAWLDDHDQARGSGRG